MLETRSDRRPPIGRDSYPADHEERHTCETMPVLVETSNVYPLILLVDVSERYSRAMKPRVGYMVIFGIQARV